MNSLTVSTLLFCSFYVLAWPDNLEMVSNDIQSEEGENAEPSIPPSKGGIHPLTEDLDWSKDDENIGEINDGLLKYAGVFGGPGDYSEIDDSGRSRRVKRF